MFESHCDLLLSFQLFLEQCFLSTHVHLLSPQKAVSGTFEPFHFVAANLTVGWNLRHGSARLICSTNIMLVASELKQGQERRVDCTKVI